jgi:hypothetical protein
MRLRELDMLCEAVEKRGLHYKQLRISGGEPTVWYWRVQGLRILREAKIADKIVLFSNCIDLHALLTLIELGLIDSIKTMTANTNKETLRKLRKLKLGKFIDLYTGEHKPLPLHPFTNVLPASCNCNQLCVVSTRVYQCSNYYSHMRRMGKPIMSQPVTEDWPAHFAAVDRLNSEACTVCLANRKVWKQIPSPKSGRKGGKGCVIT